MGSDARWLSLLADLVHESGAERVLPLLDTADSPDGLRAPSLRSLGLAPMLNLERGGVSGLARVVHPVKPKDAVRDPPMDELARSAALAALDMTRRASARGPFDLAVIPLWFWGSAPLPARIIPELRVLSPGTIVVIVTDDVHAVRSAGIATARAAFDAGSDPAAAAAAAGGYAAVREDSEPSWDSEAALYALADVVATVSDDDRAALADAGVAAPLVTLPYHVYDCPPGSAPSAASRARTTLVFVGGGANDANVLGTAWLVRDVLPALASPSAELVIVGDYDPATRVAIAGLRPSRISFTGRLSPAELSDVYDAAAAAVAPVFSPSGIATKIIHAALHGLPVITTSAGLAGLGPDPPLAAADSAPAFAAAIDRVLASPDHVWDAQSASLHSWVIRTFAAHADISDAVTAALRTPHPA